MKFRNQEWNLSSAPWSNDVTAECLIKLGEGETPYFSSLLERLLFSICGLATPIILGSAGEISMNPSNFSSILAGVTRFGLPAQQCKGLGSSKCIQKYAYKT